MEDTETDTPSQTPVVGARVAKRVAVPAASAASAAPVAPAVPQAARKPAPLDPKASGVPVSRGVPRAALTPQAGVVLTTGHIKQIVQILDSTVTSLLNMKNALIDVALSAEDQADSDREAARASSRASVREEPAAPRPSPRSAPRPVQTHERSTRTVEIGAAARALDPSLDLTPSLPDEDADTFFDEDPEDTDDTDAVEVDVD